MQSDDIKQGDRMIPATQKMPLPVDYTVNSSDSTGTPPKTFGRTMSVAEPVENDDQEQDKENKCPNHDERKRVQKRARDEEGKSVEDGAAGEKSPSKVLLPRQLVYPEDDVLGTIAALAEDDQEEIPATQPYPSEQEDARSQSVGDGGDREEGECSPESQLPISG